jgi:hypothetical protein
MPESKSSLRRILAPIAFAAALLAGCATPDSTLVGADRAAVQSRIGTPAERYPLAGGGERWMYPIGSYQQRMWGVDFDAAGRVVAVTQLRTAENFARVRIGVDTGADILRDFGQPRMVQPYAMSGLVGWLYPYREAEIWNSEMVIYFKSGGDVVVRIENGPDPRFLGGNNDRK